IAVLGFPMSVATASADSAMVNVTLHDGRVSIVAKDATISDILAMWARVGQTSIVNGDKVTAPRVTLELSDVPEERALEILLRSVSGYLAMPRSTSLDHASRYERLVILPTSTA